MTPPEQDALPSGLQYGPLASAATVYETPDGRRWVVTFANRGATVLSPVRNGRGDLWAGQLLPGDRQPTRFEDWVRAWIAPELLRPVGRLPVP